MTNNLLTLAEPPSNYLPCSVAFFFAVFFGARRGRSISDRKTRKLSCPKQIDLLTLGLPFFHVESLPPKFLFPGHLNNGENHTGQGFDSPDCRMTCPGNLPPSLLSPRFWVHQSDILKIDPTWWFKIPTPIFCLERVPQMFAMSQPLMQTCFSHCLTSLLLLCVLDLFLYVFCFGCFRFSFFFFLHSE